MTVKDQKFTQRLHNIRDASGRFRKVEAIETRKEKNKKGYTKGTKSGIPQGNSSLISYPRKTITQQNE